MSVRIIVGAFLFASAMAGGLSGNQIIHKMINELNQKSAEGRQISHYGFWPGKFMQVYSAHVSQNPPSALRFYLHVSIAALPVSIFGFAVCIMIRFQ